MRDVMNQREVARYHRLLESEDPKYSIEDISKILRTNVATLKKFSPEYLKKVKARQAEELKTSKESARKEATAMISKAAKIINEQSKSE